MDVTKRSWHEPKPEECSRVTNSERFRPLHQHALDLLARLEATYDVTRTNAFELVSGIMRPFDYARPPVTLTPVAPDAAPVAIAFTTFPSVIVRYGRWHAQPFPSCGCDACAEDAAGEAERLDATVEKVVGGQFSEELRIPLFGHARLAHAFPGSHLGAGWGEGGWTTISRSLARALVGHGPRAYAGSRGRTALVTSAPVHPRSNDGLQQTAAGIDGGALARHSVRCAHC